jgi:hypothetical protein
MHVLCGIHPPYLKLLGGSGGRERYRVRPGERERGRTQASHLFLTHVLVLKNRENTANYKETEKKTPGTED